MEDQDLPSQPPRGVEGDGELGTKGSGVPHGAEGDDPKVIRLFRKDELGPLIPEILGELGIPLPQVESRLWETDPIVLGLRGPPSAFPLHFLALDLLFKEWDTPELGLKMAKAMDKLYPLPEDILELLRLPRIDSVVEAVTKKTTIPVTGGLRWAQQLLANESLSSDEVRQASRLEAVIAYSADAFYDLLRTSARTMVSAREFLASLDLTEAYLHIGIRPDHQQFLRFAVMGQHFQFQALPFGLATAPRTFTKIMVVVAVRLRKECLLVHPYLDDWLIRAKSKALCQAAVQRVLQLLRSLGWVVNVAKSHLVPSQSLEYLGALFDTCQGTVSLTQGRMVKLQAQIRRLLIKPFTFPLNERLEKNFHGYWFREDELSTGTPVATTNSNRKVDESTSGRFTIFGNLSECDCSFRINEAMIEDTGRYYFRLEGGLMHSYLENQASITIRNLSKQPDYSISIPIPDMLEPDVTVMINCTAPERCKGSSPIITWKGDLTTRNSTTKTTSSSKNGILTYSSSFTFITSTEEHRKNLTCSVYYPIIKMSREKTVTFNVKSSPCHDRHTVDYANVSAAVSDEVGMCVVIMCQFTFPLNVTLGKVFHGYWFREGDSSQGNPVASTNISTKVDERTSGRFNIIGNISKCDCTLRIDDAMKEDTGRYYFRFEGGYMHSYVSQPASVTIRDFTNEPEFSIQIPEMLEPDVTLTINCTAPGRCSGTTPIITWIEALTTANSTTNTTSPYNDGTFSYSSSFTFTASTDDHRKNLTCLVYYPAVKMSTEKTVILNVKSSPCHDRYTVFYANVSAPVIDEVGMCVVIMCQFTFPLNERLEKNFHGYWFREDYSSIPVATTNTFIKVDERTSGRFTMLGNVSKCDCSFRIDDAIIEDTGRYYFRLEGGLMHNYLEHQASVTIRSRRRSPGMPCQSFALIVDYVFAMSVSKRMGTLFGQ
ncbi:uncharacterized protein LOC115075634 [Rhinatrema bivittatum]|uniref:uncharacterized protein LOC115075634 n=1 Tax=Rhinatrema bivittatum TaxID=194408 RepID=UPI00112B6CA8|nr:uncharacterized protein LOC115075634 [Rhinatrema bivittatum]